MVDLLEDLRWRGLIHQSTDADTLRSHLGSTRTVYSGFDPTADSLAIGNLVPLLLLRRFQDAGHRPVALMGGGTGLIGDPSGKEQERQLRSPEQIAVNLAGQRPIYERLLDLEGPNAAVIVDNAEWLTKLSFVEALRDVGKHFSVNMMIQKDSVRERLNHREQGISYTEFSYMLLQAYDFQVLAQRHGVTVQLGGSDQWGNIVAGIDLVRRTLRREVFGLTNPLVTKADGGKFGKSETGALWLTRARTSPYAFYQFWLNADDEDVPTYLKFFTLFDRGTIEELLVEHEARPGARTAHRELADHVTTLLHGPEGLAEARQATEALFSGELRKLDLATLRDVLEGAPSSDHAITELSGDGLSLVDLLPLTTLAKSKREARDFLSSGAVSVNGDKVSLDSKLQTDALLHGSIAAIRRGKKTWHVTRWS